MGISNTPEWFVDFNGSKRGPYSGQQIEEFFRNGDVHPDTLLYHSQNPSSHTTVRQLLDLSASALPARPRVDLNKPTLPPSLAEENSDPTLSLFDALQSSKQKKQTHMADPSSDRMRTATDGTRLKETQVWFIGAMVLIMGTLVWGTTKLIGYSNELATAKVESAEYKPPTVSNPPQSSAQSSTPASVQHSAPSVNTPQKNLSDYLPKSAQTKPVQAPFSKFGRANDKDRERDRHQQRELDLERERQKQRDLERDRELEREREMEYDRERKEQRRRESDPSDHDAGTLQQAPVAVPPPPPGDPDAAIID